MASSPTMMFRVGGVDPERALATIGEFKAIDRLMSEASAKGYRFPREGAIVRPQKNPTEWRANVTQIRNARGALWMPQMPFSSAPARSGKAPGPRILPLFEERGAGVRKRSNCRDPPQVGIRETRRIDGLSRLSGEDIVGCSDFEDAIGVNAWPMELHVAGKIEWGFFPEGSRGFCQLPFRMLVPKGISNLFVAGRCASMTHEGQSAARASGACFVMGQAAGTAAAMVAGELGRTTRQVDVAALQQKLTARSLPGHRDRKLVTSGTAIGPRQEHVARPTFRPRKCRGKTSDAGSRVGRRSTEPIQHDWVKREKTIRVIAKALA